MSIATHRVFARSSVNAPFAESFDRLAFLDPVDLGAGLACVSVVGEPSAIAPGELGLFAPDQATRLRVTESQQATVPFVRVDNSGDVAILLIAGQLIRGGKQNRGINADALVAAGGSADIPVTCVEQGRWSGGPVGAPEFRASGFEPSLVRSMKQRDVSHSRAVAMERRERMERAGAPSTGAMHCRADQHSVWEAVREFGESTASHAPNGDLIGSMERHESARGPRPDAELPPAAERSGLLFFLDGEFIGGDLFGTREWSSVLERSLVRSASMSRDYVRMREMHPHFPPFGARRHRSSRTGAALLDPVAQAQAIVGDALHGRWDDRHPVGSERSIALSHPFIDATATLDPHGRLLHLLLGTVRPAWVFGLN